MLTRFPPWLWLVLLTAFSLISMVEWQAIASLRDENRFFSQESSKAEKLREENAALSKLQIDRKNFQHLIEDNKDLHKLRNEVRLLRERINREAETTLRLKNSNQELRTALAEFDNKSKGNQANSSALLLGIETAKTPEQAKSMLCVHQMLEIVTSARIYAIDNDTHLPSAFPAMKEQMPNAKILVCPSDEERVPVLDWKQFTSANASYQIVNPGLNMETTDAETVFIRCPMHGHVGLYDGSVVAAPEKPQP